MCCTYWRVEERAGGESLTCHGCEEEGGPVREEAASLSPYAWAASTRGGAQGVVLLVDTWIRSNISRCGSGRRGHKIHGLFWEETTGTYHNS